MQPPSIITPHQDLNLRQPKILPWKSDQSHKINAILALLMQNLRSIKHSTNYRALHCQKCRLIPEKVLNEAMRINQPITMVLPAFPAKSPNPAKVLGTLPDMAERLSLEFLSHLCKQIQDIYPPGAQVILCSDGRVFNDAVGIHDNDVTDYQRELALLIKETSLANVSTFNLDDMYSDLSFNHMRDQLMKQYGESLETLKNAVRKGSKRPCSIDDEEVNRQYCGITRFLVEDAMRPDQSHTRNVVQKASRQRAYVVIQRSRAWSALIEARFPHALRLSIHPQICGTSKLGIRLMEAESWLTPWHGVAMDIGGSFVLLKRAQAEQLGAQLVYRENRPSHYELIDQQKFSNGA